MKTFKDFVFEMPRDKEINHGSWERCAVGDYRKFMEVKFPDEHVPYEEDDIICDTLLYECLNNHGEFLISYGDGYYESNGIGIINTYGDIQDYYDGLLELTEE